MQSLLNFWDSGFKIKSKSERFAGAIETYCIEALMQDEAQAGTPTF